MLKHEPCLPPRRDNSHTQSKASHRWLQRRLRVSDRSGRNIGSLAIRSSARPASGPSASSTNVSPQLRSASNTSRMRSAGYFLPLVWMVTVLRKRSMQLTNSVAGSARKPSGLSRVNSLVCRSISGRNWRNMIMVCVVGMLELPFRAFERIKDSGGQRRRPPAL